MTAKEMVYDRLQGLPDTATLEQIRDDVDALIGIEEGLEDFRLGNVHSHEAVMEMVSQWTTRKTGQHVQPTI